MSSVHPHPHPNPHPHGRRLVAAAFAVMALVAALPAARVATAAPAPGVPLDLRLVSQQFDLDKAGVFSAVIGVPDSIDAATLARSTLVVTAYSRVANRSAVRSVLEGELPRAIDSVDVPATSLLQISTGQLQVVVPLESVTRTPPALQFPRSGLYPVALELSVDGNVLADLLTFVHRLPDSTDPKEVELPIAVAMSTTSPVTLDALSDVVVNEAAMSELRQLADLLEASDVPVAVRIPPALLAAVEAQSPEGAALAKRVASAMDGNDLISGPSLPLDPSAAAAAGQQTLYTQWLRDGEDVLAGVVTQPSIRTTVFVDQPLSTAGGSLERDLGARLMVMPPALYDTLPNTFGAFTDPSQLVRIAVGPGVTVHAAILDREVGDLLSTAAADPELNAIYTATSLLALRQQIVDSGGDPATHGVTIGTPSLGLPDTGTFAAIASLLAVTEGLDTVSIDTLGVRTADLVDKGAPVVVGLPDKVDPSITGRISVMDSLQREATSTGSMLDHGDARAADWDRVLRTLPSSALTDTQADALTSGLRAEFADIRHAIQTPAGFSFTLTSRKSTVPIKVLNTGTIPLTVQIRMTSSKLLFPDGPQVVTLLPGEYTEVKLRMVARSNNQFPATLEIYTPDGGIRLGPAVPLTANVKALSGLGNLVTGALLLVLLAWWARHVRQNRRDKATRRHPVGAARGEPDTATTDTATTDDTTDDDTTREPRPALSPDAEASTLPPS